METFEIFSKMNQGFGRYGTPSDKEMRECYEIAQKVERRFMEKFGAIEGPRLGDVVEFADDFRVYEHGQVTENLYGGSKYGMLCICQNGRSFTSGEGLSTSGGSFTAFHESRLKYVCETTNTFWTWGCYGAGASQGINFTMPVRKWIIPYEKPRFGSKVTFRGRGVKHNGREWPAVSIENFGGCMGWAESFVSIKAFKAWADYVGYEYGRWGASVLEKASRQRIANKCYTDKDFVPPVGAKPMKMIFNGRVKDGYVVTTDEMILYLWPNIYDPEHPEPSYGTPEYEEQFKEFRKYSGNPMGIEL